MTAPVETLRQACLVWVMAYANPAGTALAADEAIFADQPFPRPDLPYLTINVIAPGATQGFDEEVDGLTAGVPTKRGRGHRTATISIQGYGEATAEWLEELRLSCATAETVADTLEAAGWPRLGFFTLAGIERLTELLDSSHEPRYGLDVTVHYTVTAAARTQVELATIAATVTQSSDAYPDLETEISVSV